MVVRSPVSMLITGREEIRVCRAIPSAKVRLFEVSRDSRSFDGEAARLVITVRTKSWRVVVADEKGIITGGIGTKEHIPFALCQ